MELNGMKRNFYRRILYISLLCMSLAFIGCAQSKQEGTGKMDDKAIPTETASKNGETESGSGENAPVVTEAAKNDAAGTDNTAAPAAENTGKTEGTDQAADENSSEVIDAFARIYPDKDTGRILSGKEFNQLASELTKNIRGRLTEITYTYMGTKISMETLVGNRDNQQEKHPVGNEIFQLMYDESEYYNYVLYLPKDYDPKDKSKKWPVIYFLHGIGESGNDLTALLNYGVPKYIKDTGSLDAIMIAPQCPGDSHWADTDVEEPRLKAFIEENVEKYNIDSDRQYLTGLSMGGRGTWKQALAMPDTFAAIAVVCGRTNTCDFSQITDMPIWMFHGAIDGVVPFQNVNRIVEELFKQDHKYFKLTVYPYLDHDSWTSAYARPDLYEWLFAQNLKNRQQ